jgi:menaquinone-9 beta-reductase
VSACDVLVVGAGPAGIAAALTAQAHELRAIVVDKATFPRDKTCGDGLTASALRRLEHLGVDLPAVPGFQHVSETVLVSPSGREVTLPLPGDGVHSAVVPRRELDAALVRRVREVGVDVRDGNALVELEDAAHGLQDQADGLVARLGDGTTVRTSYLVAADGHWSTVRRVRARSAQVDLGTWHAFRQYFAGVDERRQCVLFEPDVLPGYAWLFPLPDGRANVGICVVRDGSTSGKQLARLWRDVMARPRMQEWLGPNARPEEPARAWPIPASFSPDRLIDGRVLYVGDAAGVVDPMTGEGIAQALETGELAVDAITSDGDPAVVGAHYRESVEKVLGRDLRFAANLQRILGTKLGARAAIRVAGINDWTRRSFARWMFEDYPRAVVLTPRRWRRGVLTPKGAYRAS